MAWSIANVSAGVARCTEKKCCETWPWHAMDGRSTPWGERERGWGKRKHDGNEENMRSTYGYMLVYMLYSLYIYIYININIIYIWYKYIILYIYILYNIYNAKGLKNWFGHTRMVKSSTIWDGSEIPQKTLRLNRCCLNVSSYGHRTWQETPMGFIHFPVCSTPY